jgi:glycine/D-amino acid oxidase-like deaminating enzyme
LRTTQDGRAMIGGEDTLFKSEILRDKLLPKKAQKLMTRFHELFPDIPARLDFAWAGTFGQTRDGLAYIGQTEEFPGAHFALGFGGNGITFSVIAAEIIRDTICGKVNPDAFLFRFGR